MRRRNLSMVTRGRYDFAGFMQKGWLRGCKIGPIDLRGKDLSGANCVGLDLQGANLRGANMEECPKIAYRIPK